MCTGYLTLKGRYLFNKSPWFSLINNIVHNLITLKAKRYL